MADEHWDEDDPRLQFLSSYVVLALKSRNEKWSKMVSTEDTRQMILDFFEKSDAMLLVVVQHPGGHLSLQTTVPASTRNKAVYFLKNTPCSLNKTDFGKILLCGDMYGDFFEQHCSLVNEAMSPLLCSKSNELQWPTALSEDVRCEVHELKSFIYRIRGDIKGKTFLPLPANIAYLNGLNLNELSNNSTSDPVLRQLLRGIEAVTVKWNHQIQTVLGRTSEAVFQEDKLARPDTELEFWKERCDNLKDIFTQLSDPQAQKMADILKFLKSSYSTSFKTMFERLQSALKESEEISHYLLPLKKHFELVEQTNFSQVQPLIRPLLHTVCLVWVHAATFSSSYLMMLLRKICNLLVEMCTKYLDPARIFRGELEESVERIQVSSSVLAYFVQVYGDYKKNLRSYFPEENVRPWLFPESLVFEVYELFVQRLCEVEDLFHTAEYYMKLEKVCVGGIKGTLLSSRIWEIYQEFQDLYSAFGKESYNALDPLQDDFNKDNTKFKEKVIEFDHRIATVMITSLYCSCSSAESAFKLLLMFGPFLHRLVIYEDFNDCHGHMISLLRRETRSVREQFDSYVSRDKKGQWIPAHRNMPLVSATLMWMNELKDQLNATFGLFYRLKQWFTSTDDVKLAEQEYVAIIKTINRVEKDVYEKWAAQVMQICAPCLQQALVVAEGNDIYVNFAPELMTALKDVAYVKRLGKFEIPKSVAELYEQSPTFHKYQSSLQQASAWYNELRATLLPVEESLIASQLDEVDRLICTGRNNLSWTSCGVEEYVDELRAQIGSLYERVCKSRANVKKMRKLMDVWTNQPLFIRKEDKLLNLEDRPEKVAQRYHDLKAAGESIHDLLDKNRTLFHANVETSFWEAYATYVDDLIGDRLVKVIDTSLQALLALIDPSAKKQTPAFEIKLDILDCRLTFSPHLLEDSGGLPYLIGELFYDVFQMATLVSCLARNKEGTYLEEIKTNETLQELVVEKSRRVRSAVSNAHKYLQNFEPYAHLWTDKKEDALKEFLEQQEKEELPGVYDGVEEEGQSVGELFLEKFQLKIEFYKQLYAEVEKLQHATVVNEWLRISSQPLKQSLLRIIEEWSSTFEIYLLEHVTSTLAEFEDFVSGVEEAICNPVNEDDKDALISVLGHLIAMRTREFATAKMFEPLHQAVLLLKNYGRRFPEQIYLKLQELPERWNFIKKTGAKVKQQVAPLVTKESALIRQRAVSFDRQQQDFRKSFQASSIFCYDCENPFETMDKINRELSDIEEVAAELRKSASLFEVVLPEFRQLQQCRNDLQMLREIWDFVFVVRDKVDGWKSTLWTEINLEEMDMACKRFAQDLRSMEREYKTWKVFMELEAIIKNLLASLRAVGELQNTAVRERHWQQLMMTTKVSFEMNDEVNLADLLALNLHEYEDEVKSIVDRAVKESGMERVLKELDTTWAVMKFEHDHHSTGLTLLRASEELIETLEDNQVQLQNLMTSKYITHFLDEISCWQHKLSIADQVIGLWFEVQSTWSHLESIFIGSKDIRKQLPQDTERFEYIDSEFRTLVKSIESTTNVIEVTNKSGLFEKLEDLQSQLLVCEKALAEYLETKRLAFPRFYFVSSADLLDILSNGNRPHLVARHLNKLFDAVTDLKLTNDEKEAVGMYSKDGEYVDFIGSPCDCTGPVEVWLARLLDKVRYTIRSLLTEAVATYEERSRDQWLCDYCAQVALCGSQIWWTSEVTSAFARLEEGYENALKEYNKKQVHQLNTLIALLLGKMNPADRQKVMTICTIDVHSRDVVAKMVAQKVESASEFIWLSQLRHWWDEKEGHCMTSICDAQFRYSYEYLGNTPRLVITPLTDRCYITLTQSLHLIMGGAPAGPAGTGKTETTKDLGRSLGVMVYVFNCSEQMDYKSCGNIYKGLAQTGTWGCFDEFNRISVEVLSVIAVQVKCVQDALREKKTDFNFFGEIIPLDPFVGIFVTMNPGYAGRAELPENLKTLFRPCAMVVPDYELICEIMLVAEGFIQAKFLARKFITLYTLCKELLSQQDHYDWGLRAIKSVLVVAGTLKRADPDRPEEQILMRALRDFNVPKIVSDDVSVFVGLIGDLFPTLDVPRKMDEDFEEAIKKAAVDLKLQPEEHFLLKVIQLEELLQVRHSVFVIGATGTGKSQVCRTLLRTYQNLKRRPVAHDLNPKAVTNDELFGAVNPQTREWKDGLLSVLIRDLTNISGDGPKWIILDGDIDPMWIESLNSVMDDNKVLTLASNERISLTPSMRLVFEISTLQHASPATVSRAGILYMNPSDLSWNLYITSWIEAREVQSEKANLVIMVDKYVPPCLEILRLRFKKIVPIPEISHVQMLCYLLDCLLTPENIPSDSPKELYEQFFVFACIWAFGAALYQDHLINYRAEFSKWWSSEFKYIKFPSQGTVFDYFIDPETKKFVMWSEKLPAFSLDLDLPLQATLVHTAETVQLSYFLELLMSKRHPVMLAGNAGCGKTLLINWKLSTLSENYTVTKVPFNFYTTSGMLQKILEKPLEKKAGRNYGPPGNKQLVYFIDDMNMPEVDAYGTVQPHTLIHQHLDYGHWYDRVKLTPKDIRNCQYVTCMNPTAGSFTINSRLQRHFCVFAVCNPGMEALTTIYKSILGSHLEGPQFSPNVQRAATSIVATALILHQKVAQMFLPSATRFHYVFNLRDLSNIFQGLLFSTPDVVKTPNDLARIWMHETQRVYRDKLVDEKDIESFNKTQQEVVKKNVEEVDEARLQKQPLLYFHFAHGLGQPKYQSVEEWPTLHTILQEALNSYNDVNPVMNLVLFEDAMQHVCRISRILQAPRGNALLVGVGGSGKQSLARLAAFINGLEVFQISLHRDYGISDLKSDLAMLQVKAGQKNVGIVLLMTDAHIADEGFLVPINDFLASGEIPELFSDDEIENVVQALRNEVKNAGMVDSRENCWKFFLDRVRRQMKIVLCFSPVGSTLRVRSRKFPAIVNCTCVDWFHPWPKEALLSVSDKFLQDLEVLPGELRVPVAEFMAYVQTSVKDVSLLYLANEGRHNHSTPKTYLEQIHLYKSLLRIKHDEFQTKIMRLENGLQKLLDTATQVNDLKVKLAHQETELQRKNEDADRLIEIVREETEKVSAESAVAAEEEKRVAKINDEVTQRQKDCQEDLLKAEPNLIAAREALNTLNKANLTELKSFGSPPAAVTNVIAAVMVLLASDGKIPKDRSWRAAKISMSKVDSFLDSLVNFDKEHIHDNCLKAIQPYLQNPEFRAENVASKSQAAAGLCSWVINIIKFYEVYCDIEPKRRALEAANAELLAATEKLNEIKEKIVVLEETLDELKRKYEEALADKLQCQKEAEETTRTIVLANRLVDGLASEKVRWAVSVGQLHEYQKTLPGDVLIAVAFVSYIGCFTKQYRNDLLFKYWLPYLRDQKSLIPVSADFDPVALLTDDTTFAEWHNEGLPGDRMSAENATIFTISERWPLLIDPQLQGSKWIKVKFGDALKILRLGQKGYLELLEQAISSGDTVLLENIAENVDPVLDALIGRNTIKRGRAIKIGDKEVDYNQNFRLILHTKLSNPHYKPEMQAQTVLINFTVTQDGLEDQLLAEVVSKERPDLEQQKLNLTKQQNDFKILLKKLEDTLLQRLSAAEGNFVSDSTLVENLETTKATAAEIEMKVIESRETEAQINQAREIYRSVAIRAALLYFILKDLHKINPLYQFSLKSFGEVFHKAIANTPAYDAINRRVSSLINNITYSVYTFTTRGLFEKDKLIFSTQLALQILLRNGDVDPMEFDFLLRFPVHSHVTSPVDFLSDYSWGGLKSLSLLEEFHLLDRDVENSSKRWKKLVDSECPENEKLPQEWKSKTSLQRLCILRCLRPDRMIHGITNFVKENLGSRYVESSSIDLNESYKETAPNTAVFFILSPGVDPLKDVEKLGKQMGFTAANKKLHSVSLGQGQEKVAEKALNAAMTDGSWVILQNIHLVKKWLPTLEKMLEMSNQGCHQDFRAFISAEPADCPENHIIPQGILESSIKITNEPPTGMHANLHKALSNFNQETLEKCSHEMEFKSILFSLCYFHAVVTERRRFGPQGWNRAYPFGVGDLTISINVLYNYLETATKIPWQDLRYLFGEIMYGGHITDDWDRRLCLAYLEEYMQPAQLEGEVYLAPGFPVPPNLDYVGYQRYIDEMLPSESPYLYGLHPNAEIGFLASTSDNLFSTLLELQPRRDGAGVSSTREEKIKQTLDDIAEKLPEEFNITELINKTEEKTPYTVVALQECERMNILTREIRKSLHELDLGLKGELTITSDMEELGDCLFLDHVPPSWTKKAYPSQLGLGSWFANLLARIKELDNWCSDFSLPPSVWLPGLFNPQSFLTAIMQTTARKNEMPLDKMCLLCDVTKKTKEEFTHAPREGAYIHGLFMEGARWDVQNGCIVDSQLKELYYQMPVIFARAILSEMRETRNMYECPVYRTKARGPTYVWTFDLPTREKISKWTLAGVALLLEV